MDKVLLSVDLVNKMLKYFTLQPWGEVNDFIVAITQETNTKPEDVTPLGNDASKTE